MQKIDDSPNGQVVDSLEQLNAMAAHELERQACYKHRVFVCMGTACQSCCSGDVLKALKAASETSGQNCEVLAGGCQGNCAEAPLVSIQPQGTLYRKVTEQDALTVLNSIESEPCQSLLCDTSLPFFSEQMRVITEYRGLLDPEKFEGYIALGGFEALFKAMTEMSPQQVVHEIVKSGLRGRGGAGYPTGLKWGIVSKAQGKHKYVVCNADEGDPGAFMNRSVLEDYPFRVLEGMIIAAYAVGADRGYVYVRAEYPLAVDRVAAAIKKIRKLGLLGNNIAGTTFSFDVEVRLGAGVFVCGEETALISSIEGGRGLPRPRHRLIRRNPVSGAALL